MKINIFLDSKTFQLTSTFSPSNTSSNDPFIKKVKTKSGGHFVSSLDISENDEFLVCGTGDCCLNLFQFKSQYRMAVMPTPGIPQFVKFCDEMVNFFIYFLIIIDFISCYLFLVIFS